MLRLSEAIRLGALLHPQHFGEKYLVTQGSVVASCAHGAAEEAGWQRVVDMDERRCPVCSADSCRSMYQTLGIVVHLNDEHHWTRERIADWVETQEGLQLAPDDATPVAAAWSPVGALPE